MPLVTGADGPAWLASVIEGPFCPRGQVRGGTVTNVESLDVESSGRGADGPWLTCPWCGGIVPLAHLVPADEEPDARVAVCDSCGRRVEFLSPTDPTA